MTWQHYHRDSDDLSPSARVALTQYQIAEEVQMSLVAQQRVDLALELGAMALIFVVAVTSLVVRSRFERRHDKTMHGEADPKRSIRYHTRFLNEYFERNYIDQVPGAVARFQVLRERLQSVRPDELDARKLRQARVLTKRYFKTLNHALKRSDQRSQTEQAIQSGIADEFSDFYRKLRRWNKAIEAILEAEPQASGSPVARTSDLQGS